MTATFIIKAQSEDGPVYWHSPETWTEDLHQALRWFSKKEADMVCEGINREPKTWRTPAKAVMLLGEESKVINMHEEPEL